MADSKLLKKDDINLLPRTLKDAVKLSDGSSIDENLTEIQNANSILSITNSNLEPIVGNSLQDDITAQCEQLQSTKNLLKQRLTEKGLDVATENNFYNLVDKIGEIKESKDFTITDINHGTEFPSQATAGEVIKVYFSDDLTTTEIKDESSNNIPIGESKSVFGGTIYLFVMPSSNITVNFS